MLADELDSIGFDVRYYPVIPGNITVIYQTRINSAGALLAGRGQYSTVKNGTRMRYGTVDISAAAVQMGGILLVL